MTMQGAGCGTDGVHLAHGGTRDHPSGCGGGCHQDPLLLSSSDSDGTERPHLRPRLQHEEEQSPPPYAPKHGSRGHINGRTGLSQTRELRALALDSHQQALQLEKPLYFTTSFPPAWRRRLASLGELWRYYECEPAHLS